MEVGNEGFTHKAVWIKIKYTGDPAPFPSLPGQLNLRSDPRVCACLPVHTYIHLPAGLVHPPEATHHVCIYIIFSAIWPIFVYIEKRIDGAY
jgi:hypothetical protein